MSDLDLAGSPDDVALELLGSRLVVGDVVVRVVDVEAYGGADDPASHAFRGETKRNRSMFGPPGLLYVYRIYGMHWCANVVCGPVGVGWAVLLRGAEVLEGMEITWARRGREDPRGRLDGPGRLCQGLGIDGSFDGVDLLTATAPARLEPGRAGPGERVVAGTRIGISKEADRPWRFHLERGDRAGVDVPTGYC